MAGLRAAHDAHGFHWNPYDDKWLRMMSLAFNWHIIIKCFHIVILYPKDTIENGEHHAQTNCQKSQCSSEIEAKPGSSGSFVYLFRLLWALAVNLPFFAHPACWRHVDILLVICCVIWCSFMPGKQTGLSGKDWPDRLIGNLPNIYLYACNNPSEASLAKRRSNATIISHLTPPLTCGGLDNYYIWFINCGFGFSQGTGIFAPFSGCKNWNL